MTEEGTAKQERSRETESGSGVQGVPEDQKGQRAAGRSKKKKEYYQTKAEMKRRSEEEKRKEREKRTEEKK